MSKLEIACVICGLISILLSRLTKIQVHDGNWVDAIMVVYLIFRQLVSLALVILPLYFNFWRG